MKFYILVYKLWLLTFWCLLLPILITILALPAVLNILYKLETGITVNAQSESIDIDIPSIYDPVFTLETYKTGKSTIMGVTTTSIDYRIIVLDEFFKRNNSPLYGYGKDFVAACDKYRAPFDCTTLPAIGFIETRLCTSPTSHEQRNCWGFGGSGKNRITFSSYPEAIDIITNRLVNAYGIKYMINPKLMQHTYCGPQCNSWGDGVQNVRYQINTLARQMGFPPMIR